MRNSFILQLGASVLFAVVYVMFARLIARFLQDTSLVPYIVLLGIMIIPFSFLSLFMTGYMNGAHKFKEQSHLKMLYPFLQTVFTFGFVLLGFRIYGIIAGYFLAILVGLYVSTKYVPLDSFLDKKWLSIDYISLRKIFLFALPISLASLCFTLLRNVNTLFVKSILVDNQIVGLFTAAATLSSVPFSVFGAVPIALLPAISSAISDHNLLKVRDYITKSLRYSLLILMPLSAMVAALSAEILRFLYPAYYESAALTLSILIFASTFLAIFTCLNAVLVASDKPVVQLITVALTVVLLTVLNFLLLPRYGIVGSAIASLVSSLFAISIDWVHIHKMYGPILNSFSLFRIFLGSVLVFLIAYYKPYSGWWLISYFIFLSLLYLLFLIFLGEITEKDWLFLKKILLKP
jgi:O-antigen/teichoic acid export membrane protein